MRGRYDKRPKKGGGPRDDRGPSSLAKSRGKPIQRMSFGWTPKRLPAPWQAFGQAFDNFKIVWNRPCPAISGADRRQPKLDRGTPQKIAPA